MWTGCGKHSRVYSSLSKRTVFCVCVCEFSSIVLRVPTGCTHLGNEHNMCFLNTYGIVGPAINVSVESFRLVIGDRLLFSIGSH